MRIEKNTKGILVYLLWNYCAALIAWFLFFIIRKFIEIITFFIHGGFHRQEFLSRPANNSCLLDHPISRSWIKLRIFTGFQDFRLLNGHFWLSILGSMTILITVLQDDSVLKHISLFESFIILFIIHFLITSVLRITIFSHSLKTRSRTEKSISTLWLLGETIIALNYMKN